MEKARTLAFQVSDERLGDILDSLRKHDAEPQVDHIYGSSAFNVTANLAGLSAEKRKSLAGALSAHSSELRALSVFIDGENLDEALRTFGQLGLKKSGLDNVYATSLFEVTLTSGAAFSDEMERAVARFACALTA